MSPPPDDTVGEELETIANQDPELYGEVGDTFVKCGKCQACYTINLEVRMHEKLVAIGVKAVVCISIC